MRSYFEEVSVGHRTRAFKGEHESELFRRLLKEGGIPR